MLHGCRQVSAFVAVAIPPQNVGNLYFTPGAYGPRANARSVANKRKGENSMTMSEMGTSIVRYCLALVVIVLFACSTFAQSTTDGAIGGTVMDPSGAAVPNAKVTVKNIGTNAEETVMTDDTGYFRVGKLQPATYTVTVDAQGFAPFKAEKVIVQVGSVTDISARLNVASAGATVVVSAEVPQSTPTLLNLLPPSTRRPSAICRSMAVAGPISRCLPPQLSITPADSDY